MTKKFHVDRRVDHRRVRPLNVFISCVVLAVLVGGAIVYYDIVSSPTVIDETKNKPITGTISEDISEEFVFDNEIMSLRLPGAWEGVAPLEGAPGSAFRFISKSDFTSGRSLDIFVDDSPSNPKYTKIIPVIVNQEKLLASDISPQCYTFTDDSQVQSIQAATARWETAWFPCEPNETINVVGIAAKNNTKGAVGVDVAGRRVIMLYTDHSSKQDNRVFLDIINKLRFK